MNSKFNNIYRRILSEYNQPNINIGKMLNAYKIFKKEKLVNDKDHSYLTGEIQRANDKLINNKYKNYIPLNDTEVEYLTDEWESFKKGKVNENVKHNNAVMDTSIKSLSAIKQDVDNLSKFKKVVKKINGVTRRGKCARKIHDKIVQDRDNDVQTTAIEIEESEINESSVFNDLKQAVNNYKDNGTEQEIGKLILKAIHVYHISKSNIKKMLNNAGLGSQMTDTLIRRVV